MNELTSTARALREGILDLAEECWGLYCSHANVPARDATYELFGMADRLVSVAGAADRCTPVSEGTPMIPALLARRHSNEPSPVPAVPPRIEIHPDRIILDGYNAGDVATVMRSLDDVRIVCMAAPPHAHRFDVDKNTVPVVETIPPESAGQQQP